ncbi:hypothetical protein AY600_02045 [Phormidium willei BDU 130791]|nr:hypothetical protein AY600_02045 [Phormidium willei BDU 130791]
MIKPGCHGSYVVRRLGNPACAACRVAQSCETAAHATAQSVRDAFGVSLLPGTPVNIKKPSAASAAASSAVRAKRAKSAVTVPDGMTKKGAQAYSSLTRAGFDEVTLRATIKADKLDGIPLAYVRSALELLRVNGTVSRDKLRDHLMRDLNWNHASADSHVNILKSALTYLNVITTDGKSFTLND